jgi:glycosyltransferase involved in cell wall biosynthesis
MVLVSVIIPTFNRFDSLKNTIQSVINQTYKNIEIIVINDCSDDSRYYTQELENMCNYIKIIHLPINLRKKYNVSAAQGKTKEEGIKIAKGEWIAFLDDDDYWMPNKLEVQLNYLDEHHDIKMCSSNMIIGYETYNINNHNKYCLYFTQQLPKIFDLNTISNVNYINNSSVLIHSSLIKKVGEFKLGNTEDYDYWKRCLKYTNNLYIDLPLIYYDMSHNGGSYYK